MQTPTQIVQSRIKRHNLYADEKSLDKWTGKTKRKYKLAGSEILEKYFFNILTRNDDSCKGKLTVKIEPGDWEARVKRRPHRRPYLSSDPSYCDISKYEILDEDALFKKISDPQNGFFYVARLCSSKCGEVCSLGVVAKQVIPTSKEAEEILMGVSESAEDILTKLRLN